MNPESEQIQVLLADDDVGFCELLSEYLRNQGFEVSAVHDGLAAIEQAERGIYDVMVLDVMMPKADGFRVLERLRANQRIPVVMLTARGEDIDRIVGLELGADDYVSKPCNPRELAARLRAVLRRSQPNSAEQTSLRCGDLELLPASRSVRLNGQAIELTGAEFDVLRTLIEDAGQVIAKEDLSRRALNRRLGAFDRSIDMHISRLRQKLGAHADGTPRVRSVRNRGYLYVAIE
ncbi:response regulator transcription factor [Solimonas terrae]|uniref:Response regulator transcription factor n=1 Tax=Solimonas terrae TaxID=1396819 RepID=A0A6M2BTN6_9GAMM|nr:response regulator transcription factor [Solimonas terrae]NGY05571.1 response regulator transcription factor [Solimonas terrae]